jgi:hypothetical protein
MGPVSVKAAVTDVAVIALPHGKATRGDGAEGTGRRGAGGHGATLVTPDTAPENGI